MGRILPGQQATLSFPETAGQPGQVFTAEVMDLPKGQGAVEVYVFSSADTLPLSLLQTAAGEVKVQVGSVSPAALALRSAGRLMGKP
ncbi:MAG: hypothetical protein HY784_16875 [Chloroflexi bacterium]|nr:hypothetical protein [Chloroflexota bacterium]